ncbi:MAG: hypothetical protein DMD30_03770 [Gemmatimonadetes bacterium]|nr:MAG: hypothetical protein DMD30_03770 [Gemmatimonadota bacterium]PYP53544.1 MAG: hypothetical protein DMD39_04530 [Gemmatimonadota bacterium]
MNRLRLLLAVSLVLGGLIITSCSDSGLPGPTGPIAAASDHGSDGGSSSLQLKALWWKDTYDRQISVSKTIDASGGTISLPQTGLTVSFPRGALQSALKITITADKDYVAYKFDPAGTQFLKDVTVTQLLDNTTVFGEPLRNQLYAAYIADDNLKLSGTLPVLEIEPSTTIFSALNPLLPQAQVWVIRHFSRYMLASG